MEWEQPSVIEIKMDAEISSYQDEDRDPLRDGPSFCERTVERISLERQASRP
jgi:hypothetical protein